MLTRAALLDAQVESSDCAVFATAQKFRGVVGSREHLIGGRRMTKEGHRAPRRFVVNVRVLNQSVARTRNDLAKSILIN